MILMDVDSSEAELILYIMDVTFTQTSRLKTKICIFKCQNVRNNMELQIIINIWLFGKYCPILL